MNRRNFMKGLLAVPALVVVAPIMAIGKPEEAIYWLLTCKGVAKEYIKRDWTSEPIPPWSRAVAKILRAEHGGYMPMRDADTTTPQEKWAWLTWGEDRYAQMLTPDDKGNILYLADKYDTRVFYRDTFVIGSPT